MTEVKPSPKNEGLAVIADGLIRSVGDRVDELVRTSGLTLPAGYSAGNALQAARLILLESTDKDGQPVLRACSRESIALALLQTVIQGLDPALQQVYFIAFGGRLHALRSYYGDLALLERAYPGARVRAQVVYEGDEFSYHYESGRLIVDRHLQSIAAIDPSRIAAAYAVVELPPPGSSLEAELMTIAQIRTAWAQRRGKEASPAHERFPEEMARKTVIQRALKRLIQGAPQDLEVEIQAVPEIMQRPDYTRGIVARAIDASRLAAETTNEVQVLDPPEESV